MLPEQQEVLHAWGRLESLEYLGGVGEITPKVCAGV